MTYVVVRSEHMYRGKIVSVRVDTVTEPDDSETDREVVEHVDSVAVVTLDERQRVLLIRQYRQPFQQYLWELPAGLCDKPGEQPLATARRELEEEAGLKAAQWTTLVDMRPAPGMSTEMVRVYQATQLTQQQRSGDAEGEEADLHTRWTPLPEALKQVLEGRITNGLAVAGLLAVRVGLRDDTSRSADAPWPAHTRDEHQLSTNDLTPQSGVGPSPAIYPIGRKR
jgi:ADP-ribose pyrophosphatase